MPNLVVTMPAFNAESTIGLAVRSTLRAMPRDSELLVLDDKSTDNTIKVLEAVKDKRLKIVQGDQNIGGAQARNRLLDLSDSQYVASMDADDVALPWRFKLQRIALESADVVFSSAIRFGDRTGFVKPSALTSLRAEEFPAALLFHCPVFHPSLAARRSALEAVGAYRTLRFAQDYDLWLRVATRGFRLRRIAVPVILYRESVQQATRSPEYLTTLRGDDRLRNSYVTLFNTRSSRVQLNPDVQSTDEIADTIRIGLAAQLRYFRRINYLHFSQILHSHRTRTPFDV